MDAAAGSADDARAQLLEAYYRAWESGDAELMAAAALALPSGLAFGPHPGRTPALIHEAYRAAADPVNRCQLAAALARPGWRSGRGRTRSPCAAGAPRGAAWDWTDRFPRHTRACEVPGRLLLFVANPYRRRHAIQPGPKPICRSTGWECLLLIVTAAEGVGVFFRAVTGDADGLAV